MLSSPSTYRSYHHRLSEVDLWECGGAYGIVAVLSAFGSNVSCTQPYEQEAIRD